MTRFVGINDYEKEEGNNETTFVIQSTLASGTSTGTSGPFIVVVPRQTPTTKSIEGSSIGVRMWKEMEASEQPNKKRRAEELPPPPPSPTACKMRVALPSKSNHWIPSDDVAIRKAVESGASLEAIAKGAVRFSMKYTITEVQDRWYSLLYDPLVSLPAASAMFDYEQSTTLPPGGLFLVKEKEKEKEKKLVQPNKRQLESCDEPFPNLDYSSTSQDWRTGAEDISSSGIPIDDHFVVPDHTKTICPMDTDNYLEELSHSLLNFTNEEEQYFMDAGGKDYYDGLNSLLQIDVNQEEDNIFNDVTKPDDYTNVTALEFELSDGHKASSSEDKTVSSSIDFTICVKNTADTDVPSSIDSLFPNRPSASSRLSRRFAKSKFKDCPWFPKAILKVVTRQKTGSQEKGKLHQTADGGLPNGRVSSNRDSKVAPLPVAAKLKEDKIETTSVKQLSHIKSADSKDKVDSRLHKNASGFKQESEVQMNHQQLTPDLLDDQQWESDDEIPHFSDVEAMILDMDLDPEDEDVYEQEVSKYLNEDAMKAIVRLEQGANSCVQRDIAHHKAFAILYGRLSKHYIKKPEVLIGRTTDDMIVDIDLGRGGIGNRISRRQALISMDKDGSFRLTNLGKFPILINNKEVVNGEAISIAPNSLIEIRGMPFIFDINKTCLKQFLERKEI
ncbi:hypothetical protein ACFE04_027424 [Oxalis oulophora]